MILGFAHPALVVPDLERASAFYAEMFGFEMIAEEGWANAPAADRATGLSDSACRAVMMRGHNCFLELFEFQAPDPEGPDPDDLGAHEPGIRHLSFYVDDCRAEYMRLLQLGGRRLGEVEDAPAGGKAVYGRDPFGNILELCEVACEEESLLTLPGVSTLGSHAP